MPVPLAIYSEIVVDAVTLLPAAVSQHQFAAK
jgi:hypothetical protein